MRILAISDVHDEFERFAPDTLPAADLVIVCGDLTNYGFRAENNGRPEVSRAVRWLSALAERAETVWIPGNHDFGMSERDTEHIPNLHYIEGSMTGEPFTVTDHETGLPFTFFGVNCSPCFDKPELTLSWANMTASHDVDAAAFDFEPVNVVVSHCPPLNCLDYGGHVLGVGPVYHGSPGLRDYIARHQPRLVLCGHCHANAGETMLGGTRIVNTARRATLIELDPLTVHLISVTAPVEKKEA